MNKDEMVTGQIALRGIKDEYVLDAMRTVDRKLFVPGKDSNHAYNDYPLSIGDGQTISQPYIVALMTECLQMKGEGRVLEIGTGSGYQTAILAEIADEVYTIEIKETLFRRSKRRLKAIGYNNIIFHFGDGYSGLPEFAPFDRIIITAAAPFIPKPLLNQLGNSGIMVLPLGIPEGYQRLVAIKKTGKKTKLKEITSVRFVPMTGMVNKSSF